MSETNWELCKAAMNEPGLRLAYEGWDDGEYIFWAAGRRMWIDNYGMEFAPNFASHKVKRWQPPEKVGQKCEKCRDTGLVTMERDSIREHSVVCHACPEEKPKTVTMYQPIRIVNGYFMLNERMFANPRGQRGGELPLFGHIKHEVELVGDDNEK